MKIALSVVDDKTWKGLLMMDDGEIYKVTLWPGSATEDWRALIQVAAWVEIDSEKIIKAISEAKERYDKGMMESPTIEIVELMKVIQKDSVLRRKIEEVMKGEQ